MTKPMPAYELNPRIGVGRDETGDEDSCDAECIEGRVQGLAVVEEGDRHGVLIVEDVTAAHTYPILKSTRGKFEKVATLEMSHEERRSLKAVDSFERHRYILI